MMTKQQKEKMMQIRVKGRSRNDIIEAGRNLGVFLEPKQGRGEDVWFGYGYLDLDKSTPLYMHTAEYYTEDKE